MPSATARRENEDVSILDRLNRKSHLDDDELAGIWSAATASGGPANDTHLTSCAQCRSRYAAFSSWLEGLREEARVEADDVFPAERLAAQQAQVFRRLEAMERPARVIAFPRFSRPTASTQGNAQRWVAAAAAAGLVIGLAAGQFLDLRNALTGRNYAQHPDITARLAPPPASSRVPSAGTAPSSTGSDEALLYGEDVSPSLIRVSALQPIDAITPRAQDLDRPR
jgi:hypothetical protein